MYSIDIGDFFKEPLSFGFNARKRIFLFLFACFDFEGPYGRQTDPIFLSRHFLEFRGSWEEEVNRECTEEEKRGHHMGPLLDHVVGPIFPILVSMDSSWPETDCIKEPSEDSRRGCGETQNTPNGSIDYENRREDIFRAAPDCPSTSSTPSPLATWWRGSSSPPGLWDCGSNLYQTLSCASFIRVTWAIYHDCDHICITPMVDLMFFRWFMRCKNVYVLDVWVDVYVTLFLCVCPDQTSMIERVCGLYVLVGAIL
jgi:hypothetical protein